MEIIKRYYHGFLKGHKLPKEINEGNIQKHLGRVFLDAIVGTDSDLLKVYLWIIL